MKAFKASSLLLSSAIVLYFLVPYFIFFSSIDFVFNFNYSELQWAFKNSFLQSFTAAALIVLLTVPLSLGLFLLNSFWADVFQKLLLLPQILPTFFSILIAFSLLNPFPMGNVGIIFIFVFVHLGFSVVLVHSAIQEKIANYATVSEVFNLKKSIFFRKILLPLIAPDLWICFLMVFIFCFSSFSIPLIAGGGKGTNLEVLIFEKIFINQDWSMAWSLSLIQNLFLIFASLLIVRNQRFEKKEFSKSQLLQSHAGLYAVFAYVFFYVGGYLLGVLKSFSSLQNFMGYLNEILSATASSLKMLFIYFVLMGIILVSWVVDFVLNQRINWARHFLSSSTVLVGFAFYLFFPQSKNWDLIKVPWAASFLFFPVLFKSFLEKPLLQLKQQILVARVYHLSALKIVFVVLFQQLKKPLATWFSFLVIWFLSDFAIQRSLGTQSLTLGLMAEGFLSSYRLGIAYGLSLVLIAVWLFVLAGSYFFIEVIRVGYKKFKF